MNTEKRDTVSPLQQLIEYVNSMKLPGYTFNLELGIITDYATELLTIEKEYWLSMQAGRKTKVVCFCGSTRFAETFMVERWLLEKQGIITFGINILPNNYFAEGDAHGAEQENVKEVLDELHKRKIDLSDEVVILNVGGYIGESTRAELDYALSIGKPVKYFEPIK